MIDVNKIYEGDALSILKTFPEKIFNTCVTSPPYYGLRAYGTNPVIWDGDENCQHEFTEETKKGITGGACVLEGAGKAMTEARYTPDTKHGFCSKCGAWRGELGSEPTPELFIKHLVDIFREVRRTLRDDGTIWVNMGDSYASSSKNTTGANGYNDGRENRDKRFNAGKVDGLKPKDLIGVPWMLAFALRADGWYLRMDNIWYKRNPMPESVTDRPTKAHEYFFLLSKSQKYYYDAEAIKTAVKDKTEYKTPDGWDTDKGSHGSFHKNGREKGFKGYGHRGNGDQSLTGHSGNYDSDGNLIGEGKANKRSVWDVPTMPFKEAHFATFPQELIVDCIKAGCPEGGLVLDPFGGANTTGVVSRKLNRNYVAIELNPKYIAIGEKREYNEIGLFL